MTPPTTKSLFSNTRRTLLIAMGGALLLPWQALAAPNNSSVSPKLSLQQSQIFRAWMVRIIDQQLRLGPTPRWQQRDCAGLVRFAASEALCAHDAKWLKANGFGAEPLPPELALTMEQKALRNTWAQTDGTRNAYASALTLVQLNTQWVAKDWNQAQPGDLLFFDQGDEQHLMVWMGRSIAYHTGTVTATDNGLRAVTIPQLLNWKDTRWRPHSNNPNFAGIYRLAFLSR